MDNPTDELVQRILAALAQAPADQAERMIEQARADAGEEVREVLKSSMKAVLLHRVAAALEAEVSPADAAPGSAPSGSAGEAIDAPGGEDTLSSPSAPAPSPTGANGRSPGPSRMNPVPAASAQPPVSAAAGEADARGTESPVASEPPSDGETPRKGTVGDLEGLPLCYIFGITDASTENLLPNLEGILPQAPVHIVEHEGLGAISSPVSTEEFSQSAFEQHVKEPTWVEARVLAHERVLRQVMTVAPVLPLRFGTVLTNADGLGDWLRRHHAELGRTLTGLRNKQEWGVKIFRHFETLMNHVRQDNETAKAYDANIAAASSGKAYFLDKQREGVIREEAERVSKASVHHCHDQLAAVAEKAAQLKLTSDAAPRTGPQLVLNASYFVREDALERFHRLADQLASEHQPLGLILEVTGPWPPYSFVDLDLSRSDEHA